LFHKYFLKIESFVLILQDIFYFLQKIIMKEKITEALKSLQDRICKGLEEMDGKAIFEEEIWTRNAGGGGRTRVIQDGNILAKGGVNFSAVEGPMPAELLKTSLGTDSSTNKEDLSFYATGVSIVLHPNSPMVPITHMNVRYFEMSNGEWWFGGGIDLTPHYVIPELAKDFHLRMKSVCDRFNQDFHKRFKNWCDDYFYIKHRNEMRGIGGIFFDHLNSSDSSALTKEQLLEFIIAVGDSFVPAYVYQVSKTKDLSFGEKELYWQELRRSRYVEFNLVWDRGTKFGLQTDGRTESILMSMPPTAAWAYNFQPETGSREAETQQYLVKGIDWISI
jgi:coproporphyrinogen III oxidase